MKIIYQAADLDGRCSAAILHQAYPEAELIPHDYGRPLDIRKINKMEKVYIVGFALNPFSQMIDLAQKVDLVWIDCHKSAIETSIQANFRCAGLRSVSRGTCELTWRYVYGLAKIPYAVELISKHNLWNHTNPDTFAFHYGLNAEVNDPAAPIWDKLLCQLFGKTTPVIRRLVENGNIIKKYLDATNKALIQKYGGEIEFEGYRVLAVNIPVKGKFFESAYNPNRHDFCMSYVWNGKAWEFSLYGFDNCPADLSKIAAMYGGGGRPNVAGFIYHTLPDFSTLRQYLSFGLVS